MSLPSTNFTGIHYIEEGTAGTTPASPAFQTLPTVSGAPEGNITTDESKAIRRDRMTDDLIVVDSDVNGSFEYELSYGPFSPLLMALLRNGSPVVVNIAATDISITNTSGTITIASAGVDFITANVKVGQHVKLAGFATAANNIYAKVTVVAQHLLTVDPGTATIVTEAAGASVTIKCRMLRNGTATPKSYTFLRTIEGVTDPVYMYYRGCQIASMSFEFSTGQILTGKMDIIGFTEDPTIVPVSGQTITDVATYALMNSVQSITQIDVTGLPTATKFQSLSLMVNNNIDAAKSIGTLGATDLAAFSLDVSGDIKIYFENITVYNMYKNSTPFYLSFRLQDSLGNVIIITLPRAKFNSMQIPPDGKDSFLMLTGKLKATRDTVTNCMVQFEFFPAP